MFNAGAATLQVVVERAVEAIDTLGAPSRTWAPLYTCWAQVENEQSLANESRSAPREVNTRTMTLRLRCHPNPAMQVSVRDRLVEAAGEWTGDVTAIRYNRKRDIIWCDIETGESAG